MKQNICLAVRYALRRHWLPLGGAALMLVNVSALSAELPIVCVAGNCGLAGPSSWVTSGRATAVASGNTLTIDQATDKAVLNWASFNVGADGRVVFNQPSSSAIALNRIFDQSPSRIFGAVEANGQIYLLNPNGFVFGRTARINAAGILASTLSIKDSVFDSGLLAPDLIQNSQPALALDAPVLDVNGEAVAARLVVEEGAQLASTGTGGRVMLAAQEIDNAGSISSPDGQVILAAGEKVYLQASKNPALRGLLVEVAAGGEAWNRLTGSIDSARGNVTIAGLAVNQEGRISASTTVSANGSIRLLARENPAFVSEGDSTTLGAGTNGGRLELAATSRLEVLPESASKELAVDEQDQLPSTIDLTGREIFLRSGSSIAMPSGTLHVAATANPNDPSATFDPSVKLRVEAGTQIDLSGTDVTLPMSRNQLTVELRANELRDSPTQRNGALRGQTVIVDARVGTPIANVQGSIDAIQKSVEERTSSGGTSIFESTGDIVVARGANIDVSGGVTNYEEGPLQTSQLIGADGHLYDIGSADPNRTYVGVLNPVWRRADDRWGFIEGGVAPGIGHIESGYVEGSDAGTIQFMSPRMLLNGTFTAQTITGPYQRRPEQLPLGGELIIGDPSAAKQPTPDYRAPSIDFTTQLANIVISDGGSLLSQQPLQLSSDYLDNGFTRTRVFSNGRITVAQDAPLSMSAGSSLSLVGHSVDILADITSSAGSINATSTLTAGTGEQLGTPRVLVDDGTTLDVQGGWTNDALLALQDPLHQRSGAVFSDGGTISLNAAVLGSQLSIGDDVKLLANAGAWLQVEGVVQGGDGGEISLLADGPDSSISLGGGIDVQAFGMLGAQGGAFALAAPRIEVGGGGPWVASNRVATMQDSNPGPQLTEEVDEGLLSVGESLFTEHGFGSVTLTATGGTTDDSGRDTLTILGGTSIAPQVQVMQLSDAAAESESAATVSALAQRIVPRDFERQAVDLSFDVVPTATVLTSQIGRLTMEEGASIVADAGTNVSFASAGGIELRGTVVAPAGEITLRTSTPTEEALDPGYRADLQIHVAPSAVLDVSGTSVYESNDGGQRVGTLWDGGTVELSAERGAVIVDEGSRIDISGASGVFDIATDQGVEGRPLVSDAGRLNVFAPEAIALNGTLDAHAGSGGVGQASGGALNVTLSRNAPFEIVNRNLADTFPTSSRVLRVTGEDVVVGGPAPPSGIAVLSTNFLSASGVDALQLGAGDRIEFDDTALAMARSIVLDTPSIDVRDGAEVTLAAPYVAVTNSVVSQLPHEVAGGDGTLAIQADFIDAIGAVGISGTHTTTLASAGDIRVRDVKNGAGSAGGLSVGGDLTLRSAQLYPSTLATFAINAVGGGSTLRVEQNGNLPALPLSAGGNLTLSAGSIEQSGTIRAPFGSISLDAQDSLLLTAGSVTSVSGAGALIPFGRVENDEWIYQLDDRVPQSAVPERHVTLSAAAIQLDQNAEVSVAGGGDLTAYEWVPGSGGSHDALSPLESPGRYAILPSLRNQFAPFDEQEFATSNLTPGDSIYLSGGDGLEAGFYPLLPARYALLPGAYLIEAVSNTVDLQPGAVASLADGTPVMAGYRSFGATGLGNTRYTGFALRPGSQARDLATYQDSFASSFFAAFAEQRDLPQPMSTKDAGALTLLATQSLDLRGRAQISGVDGGSAGRLEIAAPRLEIVDSLSQVADTVQVDASILSDWRPGELWLGATLQSNTVDVVSANVSVGSDVSLEADEILLAASESVEVRSGASVATRSAVSDVAVPGENLEQREIKLHPGDEGAALAVVSDQHTFDVQRGAASDAGEFLSADGSVLRTRGTLLVDAPASVVLDGDIQANGAAWQLSSGSIAFTNERRTEGLIIDESLVARLQSARELTLSSQSTIDFEYDAVLGAMDGGSVNTQAITLKGSELRGVGDSQVALNATTVRLEGVSAQSSIAATAGTAALSVRGDTIELGEGRLTLSGFDRTALMAQSDVVGIGDTQLSISGNLDIAAARVTAESGGHTTIDALEAVRVTRTGVGSADIDGVLGGALTLSANEIESSGLLFAPSGLVTLDATTRLALDDGAVIDTAGRAVSAAGRTVYSDGGTVNLISGGALDIATNTRVDVSAAQARAGRINVYTDGAANIAGVFAGAGVAAEQGGEIDLHLGSIGDFSPLTDALQTGSFTQRQVVHLTSGDMQLANTQHVQAREIQWTTDDGSIVIDGDMTATSRPLQSSIRLHASEDVAVRAGANVSADALAGVRNGGDIELGSTAGDISIAAGSSISARGQAFDGSLRLRAAATANGNAINETTVMQPGDALDVQIAEIAGSLNDVDVVIEPVLVSNVTSQPAAQLAAIRDQAAAYTAQANTAIRNRLDPGNSLVLAIEPGIELRHDGDLTLGALNLATWRFDGSPAALSVRATGSIDVTGTISDGFSANITGPLTLLAGRSATIRMTAGADLYSADPRAYVRGAEGDLDIAPNAIIRTGTGDLQLSASGDIEFEGVRASVYTGGIAAAASDPLDANFAFADHGGSVSLLAGGTVVGAPVSQSVGDWQRRQGTSAGATNPRRTQWGTDVRRFGWNVGSLGGGDVIVRAEGDITNLSATAADSAAELVGSELTRFGGGSMVIDAGGDVSSAMLYGARGTLDVHADGALNSNRSDSSSSEPLGTVLALGSAQASVTARQDVLLESVLNATLLEPVGVPATTPKAAFSTYDGSTSANVTSIGGSITTYAGSPARLNDYFTEPVATVNSAAISTLPPTLSMRSLVEDVLLQPGAMTLFPSSLGQLELFAARDIVGGLGSTLTMSDAPEGFVPSPFSPKTSAQGELNQLSSRNSARHANDHQPIRITAGRDIKNVIFKAPKFAEIDAGRDLINMSFDGQNVREGDITSITAGRDLRFESNETTAQLSVGGPGRLDVFVRRDLDLGFSEGITTLGRLRNPALQSEEGADLSVFAGMGRPMDPEKFVADIIAPSESLRTRLVDFMRARTGAATLSYEEAAKDFQTLDATSQRPLLLDVFFDELVASGREANADATLGFDRGYDAIDALLPGSRDEETSEFDGDLTLAFSRIYTLSGGDLNILIPGGKVDVGLANPPPTKTPKDPSEIGIVAQRAGNVRIFAHDDVLVNTSRVFTLLGGDIAIWSTTGDIDAGRGAKSSVSAPPPAVLVDSTGKVTLDFSGAVAGSGIRTIATDKVVEPGDVDLIAPAGVVNAGDAGIGTEGNLNIAALQVVGLDNIQVGGTSTGVPAETSGIAASLSSATAAASSTSSAATASVGEGDDKDKTQESLAQTALSWLDVFVVGLGEEQCDQKDVECLKRQPTQ